MPPLKILILGSVSPNMARRQTADTEGPLYIWRLATNVMDKQSQTAIVGLSCSFGVRRRVNNPSPLKLKG